MNISAMFSTLQKAQLTHGIEYFDFLNTFSSKQKLQQTLKSLPNKTKLEFD